MTNDDMMSDEFLKYMVDNNIMKLEELQTSYMEMKIKNSLTQHRYKIWHASDGRWKTYIDDPTRAKGKKIIAKRSKKKLELALVEIYKKNQDFETIYHEWIDYAVNYKDIVKGTADRYDNDFDRFFKGTSFSKKNLQSITEHDLRVFLKSTVANRDENDKISKKCFGNIKSLIIGTFTYAANELELECISIHAALKNIKLPDKLFKKVLKKDSEEVFSIEEVQMISKYIWKNDKTLRGLGVLLALLTGLRVGELAALKITDFEAKKLYIQRIEVKEKDETGKTIVKIREYPKNSASMAPILLTDNALKVVRKLKKIRLTSGQQSDYLFYDERYGRLKRDSFDKRIRKICRALGIPERSMHKLRKTYSSLLFAAGVSEKIIQKQMRHQDIATTHKAYEFNVELEKSKLKILEDADFIKLETADKNTPFPAA